MRSLALALPAALLGPALTLGLTAAPAHAAEMCRGEAATIVGTGADITGTPGRDVIVTGRSLDIDAGAGDDLVCVRSDKPRQAIVTIDAGAGNDVVDATQADNNGQAVDVELGTGADTHFGGNEGGEVLAGGWNSDYTDYLDSEVDIIDNRSGSDSSNGDDSVYSGQDGLVNNDQIYGGADQEDINWDGDMGPQAVLDGGANLDVLTLDGVAAANFTVDLAAGTATRDGVQVLRPTGFENLNVWADDGLRAVTVNGTDAGNDVTVDGGSPAVTLSLGPGEDGAVISQSTPSSGPHSIDLGDGSGDSLVYRSPDQVVDLDLLAKTLTTGAARGSALGIETATAIAYTATVAGTQARDNLGAIGCDVLIHGRGGNDRIFADRYDWYGEEGFDCSGTIATLKGGNGNDKITGHKDDDQILGGSGHDRIDARGGINKVLGQGGNDKLKGGNDKDKLFGGKGRDFADGHTGRDRCSAERERRCER